MIETTLPTGAGVYVRARAHASRMLIARIRPSVLESVPSVPTHAAALTTLSLSLRLPCLLNSRATILTTSTTDIAILVIATTIITIAHRLNTVIDFDRIVVMHAGKVAECGSPRDLLFDEKAFPEGHFRKLVDSTGASSAAELRKRAETAASGA